MRIDTSMLAYKGRSINRWHAPTKNKYFLNRKRKFGNYWLKVRRCPPISSISRFKSTSCHGPRRDESLESILSPFLAFLALYGKTSAISANLFFERRTARLISIFSFFSESWLVCSRRFIIFKSRPWFSLFSILQCLGKERVTVLPRRSSSRGLGTPKVKYCVGPSSRFDKQQNIKINSRKRVYNLLVRTYLNLWSCFITHQSKCVTKFKIEVMRD